MLRTNIVKGVGLPGLAYKRSGNHSDVDHKTVTIEARVTLVVQRPPRSALGSVFARGVVEC
jgi:hypothetical protein